MAANQDRMTHVASQRDSIFVSHANPEDNRFAAWIALQLARHGYGVWCDLTKLLGGEVFWDDAEQVIRGRAAKVVYVLSTASNAKDGPLRELQLAQNVAKKDNLHDFVIPVHIDNLPHDQTTIELQRVISVPFERSWAEGLQQLLKKLEKDSVCKNPAFGPAAVTEWWRTQFSADRGVRKVPEALTSNWFPITGVPETVTFHQLERDSIGLVEVSAGLPYPAVQDGAHLISFADAKSFEGRLGERMSIKASATHRLADMLDGEHRRSFAPHFSRLLRLAWELFLEQRRLPIRMLANETKCFYFTSGVVPNDTLYFETAEGGQSRRGVVGFKTFKNMQTGVSRKRYWHYALEAKPITYPQRAYVMKSHVLFSSDGRTIWDSRERLASARRSQCWDWWNDEWRDRMQATVNWLANNEHRIWLPVSADASIGVDTVPVSFTSEWSYLDPDAAIEMDQDLPDYGFEEEDEADEQPLEETDPAQEK